MSALQKCWHLPGNEPTWAGLCGHLTHHLFSAPHLKVLLPRTVLSVGPQFTGLRISLAFWSAHEAKKCQTEPQSTWALDHKLSYRLLCWQEGWMRLTKGGEGVLQRCYGICKSVPKKTGIYKLATITIFIQVSYRGNMTLFQDKRKHTYCICAF